MHEQITCKDTDPCTSDACEPELGCVHEICNSPEAPQCVSDTSMLVFADQGTCNEGVGCDYDSTIEDCPFVCNKNVGLCNTLGEVVADLEAENASRNGIPTIGETYVLYPASELAIYYLNNGDLDRAGQVLTPAVEVALNKDDKLDYRGFVRKGWVTRRYRDGNEVEEVDSRLRPTNGDSSVLSIALGMYVQLAAQQGVENAFVTDVADANLLVQGWLNGETQVTLTGGDVVELQASLGSPEAPFRYQRDGNNKSVSVENEVRRAISLWYANKKEQAVSLVEAIYDKVIVSEQDGNQLDSGLFTDDKPQCARDAFSLLVLALDGMGILTEDRQAALLPAATGQPCFESSENPDWYGYISEIKAGNAAIPEFMYTDVEALHALGLAAEAEARKADANALAQAVGYGYSEDYPGERDGRSAITYITRKMATEPSLVNHYFVLVTD